MILAANPFRADPEMMDYAAIALDGLSCSLRTNWASPQLLEEMRRISPTVYQMGNVVKPCVHEALEESARQVFFAFWNAISVVAFPDGRELERMKHGPWHGHEIQAVLAQDHAKRPELLLAFGSVEYQTHLARLETESALLLAKAALLERKQSPDEGIEAKRAQKPTKRSLTTEQKNLYKAICDLKSKLGSEGKIRAHIDSPEGKAIREMVLEELKIRPKATRSDVPRDRTIKDVIRAALQGTYRS